jgi:hypothetical protein
LAWIPNSFQSTLPPWAEDLEEAYGILVIEAAEIAESAKKTSDGGSVAGGRYDRRYIPTVSYKFRVEAAL